MWQTRISHDMPQVEGDQKTILFRCQMTSEDGIFGPDLFLMEQKCL